MRIPHADSACGFRMPNPQSSSAFRIRSPHAESARGLRMRIPDADSAVRIEKNLENFHRKRTQI